MICSVYHELGHAVAAVTENVRVLGFGVFLLLIIPAAYVSPLKPVFCSVQAFPWISSIPVRRHAYCGGLLR
jgi:hypothetical protein